MAGGGVGFNFSPDSKEICYVSNHTEHQEANTNADLWLVPVTGGGEARNITADNEAWGRVAHLFARRQIIAYRTQTVPGYGSDRFRLASTTDRRDRRPCSPKTSTTGWTIINGRQTRARYSSWARETGYQPLFKVDLRSKKITKLIADRAISALISTTRGNFFTHSTTGKPSALYRERIGKNQTEQQLTFLNKELEDEVDIRPSETMWVTGADGDRVEVFIIEAARI